MAGGHPLPSLLIRRPWPGLCGQPACQGSASRPQSIVSGTKRWDSIQVVRVPGGKSFPEMRARWLLEGQGGLQPQLCLALGLLGPKAGGPTPGQERQAEGVLERGAGTGEGCQGLPTRVSK